MVADRKYYQGIDLKKNQLKDFKFTLADNTVGVGVLTDSRTTAVGLEYAADYSANYTDRSFIDKAYAVSLVSDLAGALVYRGLVAAGVDISGTSTGNAYIDALGSYQVGDYFIASSTGNLTTSSGTVAVQAGDSIMINTAVAIASVTAAHVDVNDAVDAVQSVFGRTGTVVAVAGDYTASEVTNVPAGAVAAVTVQAAIDELDSDKVAVADKASSAQIAAQTANKWIDAASVVDEDTMSSDSNERIPTQQSVKAYVDAQISGGGFTSNSLAIGPTANTGSPVTVNHALGTLNVIVQVYDGTTEELIDVAVDRTDANNITLDASEDITVDVTILSA